MYCKAMTLRHTDSFLADFPCLTIANTGHLGLYLATNWADSPDMVITIIAAAWHLNDTSTHPMLIAWAGSIFGFDWKHSIV